jgi:opacity protein-like surface antigen
MKKLIASLTVATLMTSVFASAQTDPPAGINYNYIEGNFAFYPDADGQDFVGPRIRGSFLVAPQVFVFGQFRYLTDDIDYTQAHLGAAYRHAVANDTDIYGGLSIEYAEFDFPGPFGSVDEVGFGVRAGLRHRLNQDFELAGEIRYVNFGGDIDDDYVGFTGTLQYFIQENLGLIGEIDVEDGEIGFLAGARFNF